MPSPPVSLLTQGEDEDSDDDSKALAVATAGSRAVGKEDIYRAYSKVRCAARLLNTTSASVGAATSHVCERAMLRRACGVHSKPRAETRAARSGAVFDSLLAPRSFSLLGLRHCA